MAPFNILASLRAPAVIVSLAAMLGLAGGGPFGGTTPAFAQSGELEGVILLDDVEGFVGEDDADTVIACLPLPQGTCVTAEGNVLTGFRPDVWPSLRVVDDDPVIETDVEVLATAFGRILVREGSIPGPSESTVDTDADFCWTFNGATPGEKVCVSIAPCDGGDCPTADNACPSSVDDKILLTSGTAGEDICTEIAEQFFEDGVTDVEQEFQFVVGLDVPETALPGSVRVATCTIPGDEGPVTFVPVCRDPASIVTDAAVHNDIPVHAVETPRCVKIGGKTYC